MAASRLCMLCVSFQHRSRHIPLGPGALETSSALIPSALGPLLLPGWACHCWSPHGYTTSSDSRPYSSYRVSRTPSCCSMAGRYIPRSLCMPLTNPSFSSSPSLDTSAPVKVPYDGAALKASWRETRVRQDTHAAKVRQTMNNMMLRDVSQQKPLVRPIHGTAATSSRRRYLRGERCRVNTRVLRDLWSMSASASSRGRAVWKLALASPCHSLSAPGMSLSPSFTSPRNSLRNLRPRFSQSSASVAEFRTCATSVSSSCITIACKVGNLSGSDKNFWWTFCRKPEQIDFSYYTLTDIKVDWFLDSSAHYTSFRYLTLSINVIYAPQN